MSDYQVGFIGIGNMGWPMAKNILKAGNNVLQSDHKLACSTSTRSASEVRAGGGTPGGCKRGRLGESVERHHHHAADRSDRARCRGRHACGGAFQPGTIVIDMSSSEPVGTKELADMLAKDGITLIDAPVSGGIPGAHAGTLTLMIGGDDEAAIERVTPVLQTMGPKLFRTGASGSGDVMKALNNYLAGGEFSRGVRSRRHAAEVRPRPRPDHRDRQRLDRPQLRDEGAFKGQVLTGKYAAGFALGLLAKDVKIASDLAGELGVMAPMCAVVSTHSHMRAKAWATAPTSPAPTNTGRATCLRRPNRRVMERAMIALLPNSKSH